MVDYKRCPMCKEEKPVSMFYKNKSSNDGLHAYCIICTKKYNRIKGKKYRKKNRDKNKIKYSKIHERNKQKKKALINGKVEDLESIKYDKKIPRWMFDALIENAKSTVDTTKKMINEKYIEKRKHTHKNVVKEHYGKIEEGKIPIKHVLEIKEDSWAGTFKIAVKNDFLEDINKKISKELEKIKRQKDKKYSNIEKEVNEWKGKITEGIFDNSSNLFKVKKTKIDF